LGEIEGRKAEKGTYFICRQHQRLAENQESVSIDENGQKSGNIFYLFFKQQNWDDDVISRVDDVTF